MTDYIITIGILILQFILSWFVAGFYWRALLGTDKYFSGVIKIIIVGVSWLAVIILLFAICGGVLFLSELLKISVDSSFWLLAIVLANLLLAIFLSSKPYKNRLKKAGFFG
ncbi:hypothetical protein [Paremcibacter congregatus]|uniref:Uncharacterized protein n=1 Tax=Paremcibacter congregatus TaxID=2043170 RepID=A0A2G4YTH0_9PROT|nr:hypothetical protein [Paremcibacter congregatus]PHZ85625.1 hypothetical protein CRD36_02760 [Paremcibacter congregatus]QDE26585.1 hypothetical protein FIV45_04520 [Paremcibacter congregatus]